ncbi:unnamed protein product [Taenia asiatica]|uniref:KTSC domain-containing protein n=1 Tax=Taenia asiatica TaxID=60517 RepID=A0A0R3W171_TAEAS|nr:unnamed protein product [Taenia asiatica]
MAGRTCLEFECNIWDQADLNEVRALLNGCSAYVSQQYSTIHIENLTLDDFHTLLNRVRSSNFRVAYIERYERRQYYVVMF